MQGSLSEDLALSQDAKHSNRSSRRTVLLLAIACGVGAANLYYAQPLAASMALEFHVAPARVATTLSLTQLGYAFGMVFLVPLGDGRERRHLIVRTALVASLALMFIAAAPTIQWLTAASLLVGFASSIPQMMIPFAVGLVRPPERPAAVAVTMSGLLSGILLSRTVSGIVGGWLGWRATFWGAALVMAALTAVLRFALPRQEPEGRPLPYAALLRSMADLVRTEPALRTRTAIGALGFAAFSTFWSTIAFHLASPGLGYGSATAGLLGAVGIVGVMVAPVVGRFASRLGPTRINRFALAVAVTAFALFCAAARSLASIVIGVVLLDAGIQASHLANQMVIYGLRPEQRNRLNAVYMVAYFAGGALGTGVGGLAWSLAGWNGVCAAGAGFLLMSFPLLRGNGHETRSNDEAQRIVGGE
ncbi:MFS transporter [Pendulispora rubella]|uniref:MFS transporter n=1 Tax=Pendulispora rubella TaxID=2741070 RepID=A0ABZ2LDG3_9BACT